jgi:hypothetical protein
MPTNSVPPKPGDPPPPGGEVTPEIRKATRDFLIRSGVPVSPDLEAAIAADDAAAVAAKGGT